MLVEVVTRFCVGPIACYAVPGGPPPDGAPVA